MSDTDAAKSVNMRLAAIAMLLTAVATAVVSLQEKPEPRTTHGNTDATTQILPSDCATFRPYSSDPNHIWNLVHRELLVRTAPDATLWGCDEVDPLLWSETRHILSGDKYSHAKKLLDEFIAAHGERLVRDPVKRALFQRNLWAVFLWVTSGTDAERQREELARRIATIMRSVALAAGDIERLPHNFIARMRLHGGLEFPDQRAGWFLISRDDHSPAAVSHAVSFPRSVFFVYLRLPTAGDTARYIETMRQYSLSHNGARCEERPCDAPQFPVGTEVALVRRALLIDTAGRAVVSPITESVQLRKYLAIDPAMPVFARRPADQLRAEFRLTQRALLEGEPSLRRVREDEADLPVFATFGMDWFEQRSNSLVRQLSTGKPFGLRGSTLQSCVACHSQAGVVSFTTYSRSHFVAPDDPMFVLVHASDEEHEIEQHMRALQRAATWKKLQTMMADPDWQDSRAVR